MNKFLGEPEQFFCRRCGVYLGTYDKALVIKCAICGALTTMVKGKIKFFEKHSPEIKKQIIKSNIKKFQDRFKKDQYDKYGKYGKKEKVKKA